MGSRRIPVGSDATLFESARGTGALAGSGPTDPYKEVVSAAQRDVPGSTRTPMRWPPRSRARMRAHVCNDSSGGPHHPLRDVPAEIGEIGTRPAHAWSIDPAHTKPYVALYLRSFGSGDAGPEIFSGGCLIASSQMEPWFANSTFSPPR